MHYVVEFILSEINIEKEDTLTYTKRGRVLTGVCLDGPGSLRYGWLEKYNVILGDRY